MTAGVRALLFSDPVRSPGQLAKPLDEADRLLGAQAGQINLAQLFQNRIHRDDPMGMIGRRGDEPVDSSPLGAAHLTIDGALSRIPWVVSTGTRDPNDDNSTLRLSWHSHHGSVHAAAGGDIVTNPADEAIRR